MSTWESKKLSQCRLVFLEMELIYNEVLFREVQRKDQHPGMSERDKSSDLSHHV